VYYSSWFSLILVKTLVAVLTLIFCVLLFLSRGKAADCCCFSFFFFSAAEEEQSRRFFGGNFQTRAHDGNKAAGLKVAG